MPAASAVMRSPRFASSAKSVRRCTSRIFSWCACRALQEGRAVNGNVRGIGFLLSAVLVERGGLECDHAHQLPPRGDERLGTFVLQLRGQRFHVDAGFGEAGQHFLAVAAVGGQDSGQHSMIGDGLQSALGIVLMVKGAASASTYRTSDAAGSLVPVLAQSSRCGRAPVLKMRCHCGEPSTVRYALYV